LPALFRAAPARLRAPLAMLVFMLFALGAARVTDFGAQPAHVDGEPRIAAHPGSRGPTDFGAIAVQPDALSHVVHALLGQASGRTLFALLRTLDARFDARGVSMVKHDKSPQSP